MKHGRSRWVRRLSLLRRAGRYPSVLTGRAWWARVAAARQVRPPAASSQRNIRTDAGWRTLAVTAAFNAHKRRHGVRCLVKELALDGVSIAGGKVSRIMRENMLVTLLQPRAWKRTTVQGPQAPVLRDRLKRSFQTRTPRVRFVGDIRYLDTARVGLCGVRDRRVCPPAGRP
jgi:hypothetical protein